MRQIVLLKDIPSLTEIKIDPNTRKPIIMGIKRKISELDKRALEAAIQLKELNGGEIVILTLGDEKTNTALLEALAMGADAVYIIDEPKLRNLDSNATSKVLEAALRKLGKYDLILCGEMSLDTLSSQIGPRLAELLDLPLLSYVKDLGFYKNKIKAIRELEEIDEVMEAQPPVIVSVVREINEPRIPSLINIMKAKKKPQIIWNAGDLDLTVDEIINQSHVKIIDVLAPKITRKQIIIKADSLEKTAKKLAKAILDEKIIEG
jgi:electron transfer flavoprotein beta subunit